MLEHYPLEAARAGMTTPPHATFGASWQHDEKKAHTSASTTFGWISMTDDKAAFKETLDWCVDQPGGFT